MKNLGLLTSTQREISLLTSTTLQLERVVKKELHKLEYFYSFHFDMLDMEPGWNKVEIPLTGTNIPDQSLPYTFGFNNTGWNGIPGDGTLDLDSIKGFAIEFFVFSFF